MKIFFGLLHEAAAECGKNVQATKVRSMFSKSVLLLEVYFSMVGHIDLESRVIREAFEYERRVQSELAVDMFGAFGAEKSNSAVVCGDKDDGGSL